VAFIQEHPGYYLRLVGERFVRLWYFFRPDYNFWFMVILPFFLIGLRHYWRVEKFAYLSTFILLSTFVYSAILYGSVRFRLPLEPLFIAFAAVYLSDAVRDRSKQRLIKGLGVVVFTNLIVWWQQEFLRNSVLSILNYLELR